MANYDGISSMQLRQLFEARNNYRLGGNVTGFNLLDTLYIERKYGLLNENFEPVAFLTDTNNTSLENFKPLAPGVYNANFVIRAFNKLKDDYSSLVRKGNSSWPPFVDTLIPKSGYKNFDVLYEKHLKDMTIHYLGLLKDEERCCDYQKF